MTRPAAGAGSLDPLELDRGFYYRQLLAGLPAASLLFDHDLRVLVAEGDAFRDNGYDPAALVGRRLEESIDPAAFALLEGPYRLALDGVAQDFEYTSPVNGSTYHIRLRPAIDPHGAIVGGMSMSVDVTRLRAAEAETDRIAGEASDLRAELLREVSDMLATPIDAIEEVIQKSADLAAVALGDACVVRVLGSDPGLVETVAVAHRDEEKRRPLEALFAEQPMEVSRLIPVLQEVLSSGRLDRTAFAPGPRADGSRDPGTVVHRIIAPLRSEGSVYGLLSVFRESTEPPYTSTDGDLIQVLADRLGVAIGSARARRRAEREKAAQELIATQLKDLAADQRDLVLQLDRTESRERALLADAVHDDPLQLVVAAMLRLDNLNPGLPAEPGGIIDDVTGMLEIAVEQLRNIIVTLTPPDLRAGLRAALESLARGVFLGSATKIEIVGPTHVRLDPQAKETVYRIVREALVNVRKHARASHVLIELSEEGEQVHIRLVDDGVGITRSDPRPGHLGLVSMRARAAAARATLSIESSPGEGTEVHLVLPMRADDADAPVGEGTSGSRG